MDNATVTIPESPTLKRDIDRLKVDLGQLRGDVSRLAGDAVHAARASAIEAKTRIDRGARTVAVRGRHSLELAEHEVITHPFIAVGGAFTVGLLAGMILSRKR
jgi:ElaB/YqjD/DUF883 family membrane-anchored ribosome-binding protein